MTQYQSALSTLIGEVLADPDLAHQDVFRRQLRAILRAAAHGKAAIMFPMISGVSELRQAKATLRRYRAAVLKAAVTGKLTREWRETHQVEMEPAQALLERILAERRAAAPTTPASVRSTSTGAAGTVKSSTTAFTSAEAR